MVNRDRVYMPQGGFSASIRNRIQVIARQAQARVAARNARRIIPINDARVAPMIGPMDTEMIDDSYHYDEL